MLLIAIVLLLSLLLIRDIYKRRQLTKTIPDIPIVSRIPFVGSLWILSSINTDNFHIKWPQFIKCYGKTFCSCIMGRLAIVTIDQQLVETLLSSSKHLHKHFLYNLLTEWLGKGLLLNSGDSWHTMRKIITPTFHFKVLEGFVQIFNRQTDVFIEKLREFADGKHIVDIYDYVGLLTLDDIAETAMGVSINAQLNADSEYVQAVKIVTDIESNSFVRIHLAIRPLMHLFAPKLYWARKRGIATMHKFTENIIQQRQKELLHYQQQMSNATPQDTNKISYQIDDKEQNRKEYKALLDILLSARIDGEPLTDQQIRDEVNTFMFEGHDTTATGTAFCLYALSRNPQIQNKLFMEIQDHFGNDLQRSITYKDLNCLTYLNCVIKESLRLYPPILAIGRMLKDDLPFEDMILPAGTSVIILLWEMLRDADIFNEPINFQPERHLHHSNVEQAFSNIPFSAGPRNCIGQKFALHEMRVIIIKVLRHYVLLPLGEDVEPTMKLVLRSKTGINMALKTREYT